MTPSPDPTRYTPETDLKIRSVAMSFVNDRSALSREDREDIEQEARMACWKWLVANPEQKLGPGLTRLLTVQAARDYERYTRRHRENESLPDWHDKPCEPTQEYDTILADMLGRIVKDESEAAIAILVVYEGLSQREAADHLGVDRARVRSVIEDMQRRAQALGISA